LASGVTWKVTLLPDFDTSKRCSLGVTWAPGMTGRTTTGVVLVCLLAAGASTTSG